ncbi:hypothetical protein DVH05_005115 [Phytophthora capsici]|nr:hypothetical protein DVH05_005115 [Phytophthora capsici]
MGRYFVTWTIIVGLLHVVASEVLSEPTHHGQESVANLAVGQRANRHLRTSPEDEERGRTAEKMFLKLSKLAEKAGKNDLSKKLEHNSWLAGGKGPQFHFQKNGWKGKSKAELMEDPSFLRYVGFDDKWMKAQQEKGLIFTPEEWVKNWNEQMKKASS